MKAKYPGTFGNSLCVYLKKVKSAVLGHDYWNIITYIVDSSGVNTAVENKVFVFDIDNSSDTIVHIDELESNFLTFEAITGNIDENTIFSYDGVSIMLSGGYDISPMVTSETYDQAVNSLKELSASLVEYTTQVETYTSAVNSDNAHINKLASDIVNYQNRLDMAQNADPVDSLLVAELQAHIEAAQAEKVTWETKLKDDSELLKSAESNRSTTSESIKTQKSAIDSESLKFKRDMISKALASAKVRYYVSDTDSDLSYPDYIAAISNIEANKVDNAFCLKLMNQEWLYTNA